MNEKRKAKWVAQTHSLENMADMMNREMRRRFRIRTNRSLVDGVLGDFALEDLDNSTEFRTLAYLDYEEMRGYMYGMLESYRHYKPLIMGPYMRKFLQIVALVLMSPFVLLVLGITISVVRLGDFLSD